jgi:cytidine deaminase
MAIMVTIRQNTPMQVLIEQAKGAIQHCYAHFSQFRIAAYILDDAGKIHIGVNIQNVSYSMTQSAEKDAIFSAVSKGAKPVTAISICTPTEKPTTSCGACRQVIREFASNAIVFSACDSVNRIESTINDLQPNPLNKEQHLS